MPRTIEAESNAVGPGRGQPVLGLEAGGQLAAAAAAPLAGTQTLDDGEIVLLKVRPSLWFVPLSARWSLAALAAAAVLAYGATMLSALSGYRTPVFQCLLGLGVLRLAWAAYLWATRWYVLTNRRVMWLSGGLRPLEFVALLPQIAETRLEVSLGQRLVGLGTLVMPTRRKDALVVIWQHLRRPQQVLAAVRKAIDAAGNNRGCR